MSIFNTTEKAFGLDISDHNLRLIQLKKRRKKIEIELFNEIKLSQKCIESGEIMDSELFLSSLKKLIKTAKGKGTLSDEVIVVLPETKTYLKKISLTAEEDELEQKIKEKLSENLPLNIDDIYMDWQIINQKDNYKEVLIGASPKNIVNNFVNILNQAGLLPIVMEIEAAAIARAAINDNETNPTQIIVDMGANRSGLFAYDKESVLFTVSLPISGKKITSKIANTLNIDEKKAEKAKIVCGLDKDKCGGALLEIFEDTIDELTKHIQKAADFATENFDVKNIEKLILCGGGANFANIDKILERKLGIKTQISDPWLKISQPKNNLFKNNISQSFITAFGLALKGIDSETYI